MGGHHLLASSSALQQGHMHGVSGSYKIVDPSRPKRKALPTDQWTRGLTDPPSYIDPLRRDMKPTRLVIKYDTTENEPSALLAFRAISAPPFFSAIIKGLKTWTTPTLKRSLSILRRSRSSMLMYTLVNFLLRVLFDFLYNSVSGYCHSKRLSLPASIIVNCNITRLGDFSDHSSSRFSRTPERRRCHSAFSIADSESTTSIHIPFSLDRRLVFFLLSKISVGLESKSCSMSSSSASSPASPSSSGRRRGSGGAAAACSGLLSPLPPLFLDGDYDEISFKSDFSSKNCRRCRRIYLLFERERKKLLSAFHCLANSKQ